MAEAAKRNGFDPNLATNYVIRIENLHKQLEVIAAERMAESKIVREDIKGVYKEAKDDGFAPQPLRAKVKERAHRRKADAARTNLADIDLIDQFDKLSQALGDLYDTPLGQAATLSLEPSRA